MVLRRPGNNRNKCDVGIVCGQAIANYETTPSIKYNATSDAYIAVPAAVSLLGRGDVRGGGLLRVPGGDGGGADPLLVPRLHPPLPRLLRHPLRNPGIVLFFKLPRKVFGLVQRHLFPYYFLLNSVLGFLTLWIFVLQNPGSTLQRWNLILCFFCEVFGMVYIVPDMIQTMFERAKMEEAAGVGQDVVGRFIPTKELNACARYVQLHSRFRLFHGLCALVNLVAMSCNAFHMYHLASKLTDR